MSTSWWAAGAGECGASSIELVAFGADSAIVRSGPMTPIVALFAKHASIGVGRRLRQRMPGAAPTIAPGRGTQSAGLGGSRVARAHGKIVGALPADTQRRFCEAVRIARLERETGGPFQFGSAAKKMPRVGPRGSPSTEALQASVLMLRENRLGGLRKDHCPPDHGRGGGRRDSGGVLVARVANPLHRDSRLRRILSSKGDPKASSGGSDRERTPCPSSHGGRPARADEQQQGKLVSIGNSSRSPTRARCLEGGRRRRGKNTAAEFIDASTLWIDADSDPDRQVLRNVLSRREIHAAGESHITAH